LFDQTFVNTHAQTLRPWTMGVSIALQTGAVAIALIAPLMRIPTLRAPEKIPVWLPLQVLVRPPDVPAELKLQARLISLSRPVFSVNRLVAPTRVPAHIDLTSDAPEITGVLLGGPGATPLIGILPEIRVQPPPAPPVDRPAAPAPPKAISIGGDVQAAKLVFGPKPVYPPMARATRTQGTVRIQAVIARDGAIRNLQVISGPPLLVNVAMEAVRQWRYKPTLLNNEPVEVITEIDVNFALNQ
jgi:protein TonB